MEHLVRRRGQLVSHSLGCQQKVSLEIGGVIRGACKQDPSSPQKAGIQLDNAERRCHGCTFLALWGGVTALR